MTSSALRPLNKLLKHLRGTDLDLLAPHLTLRQFNLKSKIEEAGTTVDDVVFLETGLVSMMAGRDRGPYIEVAMTGVEGMTGSGILLGATHTTTTSVVRISATGFIIARGAFINAVVQSETLRNHLLLYVQAFHAQTVSGALASQYQVMARLSRQLLMIDDRIDGPLDITHEILSTMLATRRPYITETLIKLENIHAIISMRGNIRIVDRDALLELSSGSYGNAEAEYRRLLLRR